MMRQCKYFRVRSGHLCPADNLPWSNDCRFTHPAILCKLDMFLTLKSSAMRLSFMENYLPVSQKDVVDGSQYLEEGSGCSSPDYGSTRKSFALAIKPSRSLLFKQWLPWLLCFCLAISNIRLWMKFQSLVFDDAVYCKFFKYTHLNTESLTFCFQLQSTLLHMGGRM